MGAKRSALRGDAANDSQVGRFALSGGGAEASWGCGGGCRTQLLLLVLVLLLPPLLQLQASAVPRLCCKGGTAQGQGQGAKGAVRLPRGGAVTS